MKKIYVINGPSLNMLGVREPDIYGKSTYSDLVSLINTHCKNQNVDVVLCQSNHEGDIIDMIQKAYFEGADGIVINPGAYTHTSIAIADALRSVNIKTVEVHISNTEEREDYRKISYIRPNCVASIIGHGFGGYTEAIDLLIDLSEGTK